MSEDQEQPSAFDIKELENFEIVSDQKENVYNLFINVVGPILKEFGAKIGLLLVSFEKESTCVTMNVEEKDNESTDMLREAVNLMFCDTDTLKVTIHRKDGKDIEVIWDRG